MPNHCENDLYISGKPEEVQRFLDFARDVDSFLDFNKFVPYPETFKILDKVAEEHAKVHGMFSANAPKDGFNQGGYEWCVKNWGTKWNAYDFSEIGWKGGKVKISFSTAWSPPIPVIAAAAAKFPELKFQMNSFEQGAAYKSKVKFSKGKLTSQEQGTYHGRRGG